MNFFSMYDFITCKSDSAHGLAARSGNKIRSGKADIMSLARDEGGGLPTEQVIS
jgi:hypothetical protein